MRSWGLDGLSFGASFDGMSLVLPTVLGWLSFDGRVGIRCAAMIASADEVKYVFPSGKTSKDKMGCVCG